MRCFERGLTSMYKYDERLVCEAGILWRRTLRRFEQKVNALMEQGYTVGNDGIQEWGFLRCKLLVVLRREKQAELGEK